MLEWLCRENTNKDDGNLRLGKPGSTAGRKGGEKGTRSPRYVCIRGRRQRDHPQLGLEKPRRAVVPLPVGKQVSE